MTSRQLHVKTDIRLPPTSPNTDFARRISISTQAKDRKVAWQVAGDTVETGEKVPTCLVDDLNPDGIPKQTVWWKFKAPARGKLEIDMSQSRDEMSHGLLGVFAAAYTGSTMAALVEKDSQEWYTGAADPDHPGKTKRTAVRMKKDQVVTIQAGCVAFPSVGDVSREVGEAVLTWYFPAPPLNDQIQTPTPLTGSAGTQPSWDPSDYFGEEGEPGAPPDPDDLESAWFTWTATATDLFTFNVTGTDSASARITIFTGTPGSLTQIATGIETVQFDAVLGTSYYIQVSATTPLGHNAEFGLQWTQGAVEFAYYTSFEVVFDPDYVDRNTNGLVDFMPDFAVFLNASFDIQGIALTRATPSGTQYNWACDLGAGAFQFGPTAVGGSTYLVQMKVTPTATEVRIGGSAYGPFLTDPPSDWWFDTGLNFNEYRAGAFSTNHSLRSGYTIDNLTAGTTDWTSDEIVNATFDATIVPPFDSEVDTVGELSIVSAKARLDFPGSGASRNAYGDKIF